MRWRRLTSDDLAGSRAQPPLGAIARHGVADFLAAGESDPDPESRRLIVLRHGRRGLQNQTGRGPFAPGGGDSQKFRAPLEPPDGFSHGKLGGQTLAALTATIGHDATTANGRHTGAEAMTAGTDQLAGLIGTLHGTNSGK